MNHETQKLRILRHMAQGFTITPLEALEKFGCFALSQRIGELKRERWPIDSWFITTKSGARVKCYRLDPNQEQVVA